MNSLSQALLWSPVQVTALAVVAMTIGALAGRRRPAAGALVAAVALVSIVGLTAAAFAPWPRWEISWDRLPWSPVSTAADTNAAGQAAETGVELPPGAFDGLDQPIKGRSTALRRPAQQPPLGFLERAWNAASGDWLIVAAVLYLAGVAGMGLRIALGFLAVRGYRRHSHPITDRRLGELADVVCAELGCRKVIELRETTRLTTPATIGWLRPMLLLPADWRRWSDDEKHAVLAHEIEHVRRGDFACWIAAQLGVALHFYHPLVHWLANRLRLQQELAADAAAARVLGGQRKYVTTLAAMALREADSPIAWPASAFLPNSKTFVRRIEMLHRAKPLRGDVSRPMIFVSVAGIVLAAVCAAGIRGSAAGEPNFGLSVSTAQNRASTRSTAVLALNQAEQPPKNNLDEQREALVVEAKIVMDRNYLKQLALAMHNYDDKNQHFPPAVVMGPDGKTPHSWRVELLPYLGQQALYQQYRLDEPWDSENNKKVLEQMPDVYRSPFDDPKSTNSGYYVFVGPGTVFEAIGASSGSSSNSSGGGSSSTSSSSYVGVKISDISDGTSNTLLIVESKRNTPWTKPEDIPFDPKKPAPELGGFLKSRFAAAMADGSARVFLSARLRPDDGEDLKWLIMRNDGHPVALENVTQESGPAQAAPRRRQPPTDKHTRTLNNLKQLMLAMHNYHDIHGHFPPAAVRGPDGGPPHSWRVELLPVLELKNLYAQYRLDQPWDSENNKKVLAQMPDVFRSPYDDPKSTNSGYYGLVGQHTVFSSPEGIKIADITDGTSNTLMLVESKHNTPWTKPEDIPFDPSQPVPELGGYVEGKINASLADGAALTMRKDRVKDQLKWVIMRDDGHVIEGPLNSR